MVKIFISYSQKDKEIAAKLKKYFEDYKVVNCFVAHDDIIPGTPWEQEILNKLQSSDYFMLLHTRNLEESYWCQQEAGIAVSIGVEIISLIPDDGGTDPVGFYAKFQGFKIKLSDLSSSVKGWLLKQGIIQMGISDELEKRIIIFKASNTYLEAGRNTKSLFELEGQFTNGDIARIMEIVLKNDQILYSWDAREYLKPFFIKHIKLITREQLEEFLKAE